VAFASGGEAGEEVEQLLARGSNLPTYRRVLSSQPRLLVAVVSRREAERGKLQKTLHLAFYFKSLWDELLIVE
jgi:hypothetical protein